MRARTASAPRVGQHRASATSTRSRSSVAWSFSEPPEATSATGKSHASQPQLFCTRLRASNVASSGVGVVTSSCACITSAPVPASSRRWPVTTTVNVRLQQLRHHVAERDHGPVHFDAERRPARSVSAPSGSRSGRRSSFAHVALRLTHQARCLLCVVGFEQVYPPQRPPPHCAHRRIHQR